MIENLKVQTLNSVKDDIYGKPILVRVDLNVPQNHDQSVADSTKVEVIKDSISFLKKIGAIPVICSHLGRPNGEKNEKYSLESLVSTLENVLNTDVLFIDDCIGEKRDRIISSLSPGQIVLLENLRFYEGEEKNNPEFASQLSRGFSYFVNEAFPASHRSHASIVGVPNIIGKNKCFIGNNFQVELENLNKFICNQKGSVALVFGGAKAKDKIKVIHSMMEKDKADIFVIAGVIGNTFLKSINCNIGKSLCADDCIKEAHDIFLLSNKMKKLFVFPIDVVVQEQNSNVKKVSIFEIKPTDTVFDIGEESIKLIIDCLCDVNMLFWNGAFGKAEDEKFSKGTRAFGKFLAELSKKAFVVIGGGDTSALISENSKERIISNGGYISTSGGSAMEFLENNGTLPGLQAIEYS